MEQRSDGTRVRKVTVPGEWLTTDEAMCRRGGFGAGGGTALGKRKSRAGGSDFLGRGAGATRGFGLLLRKGPCTPHSTHKDSRVIPVPFLLMALATLL